MSKSWEEIRTEDIKSVKDCQSLLSNLKNKTYPRNTSHTLWHSHTQQRAMAVIIKLFLFCFIFFVKGAVHPGQCGLAIQSMIFREVLDVWTSWERTKWMGKQQQSSEAMHHHIICDGSHFISSQTKLWLCLHTQCCYSTLNHHWTQS